MLLRVKSSARFCFLALLLTAPLVAATAQEQPRVNAENGVAIKGYDTVAYFTDGRPIQGKADYQYSWDDVTWRFASLAHREQFAADPERYAPQYGGFCAGSMYFGEAVAADPTAWKIVDGKLYLFAKPAFADRWSSDAAERIQAADENWRKFQAPQ
jgi:YHS domain-containing protein